MFVGTPAAQLGGSFGHGGEAYPRGVGIGRNPATIVVDFEV